MNYRIDAHAPSPRRTLVVRNHPSEGGFLLAILVVFFVASLRFVTGNAAFIAGAIAFVLFAIVLYNVYSLVGRLRKRTRLTIENGRLVAELCNGRRVECAASEFKFAIVSENSDATTQESSNGQFTVLVACGGSSFSLDERQKSWVIPVISPPALPRGHYEMTATKITRFFNEAGGGGA